MIEWERARQLAFDAGGPVAAQRVGLAAALGGTLAEPLVAAVAVPGHDSAAMDGYAVAGAGPWLVTGRVLAGQRPPAALTAGTAVEVATGAAVPTGTEAVLTYERARRDGDTVTGQTTPAGTSAGAARCARPATSSSPPGLW